LKVWIDIVNSPHVRFFHSIIRYLEEQGEEVFITARRFGDVHRLLDLFGIDYHLVGWHGVSLEEKLIRSTQRAYELSQIISREKPDVAVSKHSIELPRVAYGLNIPSVYVLDNEHAIAANKLTLSLCDTIVLPEVIEKDTVVRCGADPDHLLPYNGTSEITHLVDFQYNPHIFQDLKLDLEKEKTILMRPEPALASYLDADCRKTVLSPIVEALEDQANILVIPRFREQQQIFENDDKITLIKPPVDTFSLMKACDLVIGAGGTMNREAALLGTPVISCYPGKLLSVDSYYIQKGLMKRSTHPEEIVGMAKELLKDDHLHFELSNDDLFGIIIDRIYQATNGENK
jgi:uncharacterized protein